MAHARRVCTRAVAARAWFTVLRNLGGSELRKIFRDLFCDPRSVAGVLSTILAYFRRILSELRCVVRLCFRAEKSSIHNCPSIWACEKGFTGSNWTLL